MVNCLPVDLIVCMQGKATGTYLQPGNNLHLTNAEPDTSTVTLRVIFRFCKLIKKIFFAFFIDIIFFYFQMHYLEKEWSTKEVILGNPAEYLIWKFVSYNGLSPETINIGVHCTFAKKTAIYTIYCPYFMVNKTDHLLSYRVNKNYLFNLRKNF